jgi:hypothetical protein
MLVAPGDVDGLRMDVAIHLVARAILSVR